MQTLKQQIDDAKQTAANQKEQMTAIETDRNGMRQTCTYINDVSDSDLKAKCTDLESRIVGFKQQMDELRASANSDDKQVLNIV